MCISFCPTTNEVWTKKNFGLTLPTPTSKEAYPGYLAPIVIQSRQSHRVAIGLAEFGLIPAWSKDKKIQRFTYNARCETMAKKPSYRKAWQERRLGIVLVDYFFEPRYLQGKAEKWRIHRTNQEPMGIAILWDQWINPENEQKIISFSMITVNADAHPVMRQFHKECEEKRSPLILPTNQFQNWLAVDADSLEGIFSCHQFPPITSRSAIDQNP